jgi:hypothetical protein
MKSVASFRLAAGGVAVVAQIASAQCPQFTSSFHGGGLSDSVNAMRRFDDGAGERLFVGGYFRTAADRHAPYVAAWNGEQWSAVVGPPGTPTIDRCHALAEFDFGAGPRLVAAGEGYIAAWDGQSWSTLADSPFGQFRTLQAFDGGAGAELYVGGGFTEIQGVPLNRVAKWNGAGWSPVGVGLDGGVQALTVHDHGAGPTLYAAGNFAGHVASWNGSSWTPIGAALEVGAEVNSIASIPGPAGQPWLLAVGRAMLENNTAIARWDGTTWSSVYVQNSGRMLEVKVFQDSSGPYAVIAGHQGSAGKLLRWSPGASVFSFGSFERSVRAVEPFAPNGSAPAELVVGGEFVKINEVLDAQRIARWTGSAWRRLAEPGHVFTPTPILDLVPPLATGAAWLDPNDGRRKLVVGGALRGTSDDPNLQYLAVWDGARWSAFPAPVTSPVKLLSTWFDPLLGREVLVGYPIVDGAPGHPLRKFDGTAWVTLGAPGGMFVSNLATYAAPGATHAALFAVGPFNASQVGSPYIARFDGVSWSAVGAGLSFAPQAMVAYDPPGPLGPGLYVGAPFQGSNSNASTRMSRWDGVEWRLVSTPDGIGGASGPSALCVFDDGAGDQLFAAGVSRLFRFDGQSWSSYTSPSDLPAVSMSIFDDGAGPALYLPGGTRFRNGQLESYAPPNTGPHGNSLVAFEDEYGRSPALWFIGNGATAGDVGSRDVARLSDPCSALASYCTGTVNAAGCVARVAWSGEPSLVQLAATPFTVSAVDVLNQKNGLFFYGLHGAATVPFQGGTLCVRAPTTRTPLVSSGGNSGVDDCSGQLGLDFSDWIRGAVDARIEPGSIVHGQWWYRNPTGASGAALSNAVRFEVRP